MDSSAYGSYMTGGPTIGIGGVAVPPPRPPSGIPPPMPPNDMPPELRLKQSRQQKQKELAVRAPGCLARAWTAAVGRSAGGGRATAGRLGGSGCTAAPHQSPLLCLTPPPPRHVFRHAGEAEEAARGC
jgi:hypothetical protein